MAMAAPKPSEMFSDATSGTEVVERFEDYKSSLAETHKQYGGGGYVMTAERGLVKDTSGAGSALAEIQKSLTPEQLASLGGELAALNGVTAELGKDWSIPAAANNTALTPYDLEAPAKLLVPRNTPLRNRLPRTKGQGLAVEYRRVLGWSNSSTGGVADKLPFTDSQADPGPTFGSLALRRGQKIQYASDVKTVSYVEMSLSDQVNWKAQFAGQGFQDIRSLSQTALLWAHMTGEEKAILYGRGASAKGYAGAISAPTISVLAATGGTVAAGTYYIKVTARGGGGASVPSSEVNTGALSGGDDKFTITVTSEPTGALGYDVYIGTTTNVNTYVGSFTGTTYVVTTTPATGGAAVPSSDTTVSSGGYDGYLTVLADPTLSGYVRRVNGNVFDGTTPANSLGDAPFQDAFSSLYGATTGANGTKLQADPDEIWLDGNVRRKLGDFVKLNANATGYRIALTEDQSTSGVTIGSVAAAIQNQTTGKMVDLNVHPFMPQGAALILSNTLPVPDSEIQSTVEIRSVQDYMAVEWPTIQFTWDTSTYWMGTMVHYAPQWSGCLLGLS